jgi:hypothetical protein
MLAQQFDRKRNKKATGYIRDAFFLDFITDRMLIQKRTSKKRLEEALQYGFLERCGKKFLIRSYRSMVKIAMDHHQEKYETDMFNTIPPELFLKSDRKFTLPLKEWIDPTNYKRTIVLLSGIASIQNSINYRGKLNQSKILNCDRRTIQRRKKDDNTREHRRFIIIDVRYLLEKPARPPKQIIKILMEAESIYRRSKNYLRGRQLLHNKWINGKNYLAIEIPGVCISTSKNMLETPSIRESARWLHLKSGGLGHRSVSMSHVSEGVVDPNRSTPASEAPVIYDTVGRKRLPLLVEWPVHFVNSRGLGGTEIPDSVLFNYLKAFEDLLNYRECLSHILKRTGAIRTKPITEDMVSVHTETCTKCRPQLENNTSKETPHAKKEQGTTTS